MASCYGVQGFECAAHARAGAQRNLGRGVPFCVVEKHGNYGWLSPLSYANELVAAVGLRVVMVVEEKD